MQRSCEPLAFQCTFGATHPPSNHPPVTTPSGTQRLPIQYRTLRSENKFRSDKDAAIL